MHLDWKRQRHPDDVPTPAAIAVSDFCRRAGAAATAHEVRDALSFLSAEDDFRVRALTDAEPRATPLGPFAAVDILLGTDSQLASARQRCGYYDLLRRLVPVPSDGERAPEVAPVVTAAPRALPAPRPAAPPVAAAAPLTVAEKIAPKKRVREEVPSLAPASPVAAMNTPPRGRFTQLATPKLALEMLRGPAGREVLSRLLPQNPHRFALLRSLAAAYDGPRGRPLTFEDLRRLLEEHGLWEALVTKERELILGAFTEHLGALGRVAWAAGMSRSELQRFIEVTGLSLEVESLRERFRREALAAGTLERRLDLFGRQKYLADLGIEDRLAEVLSRELSPLVREAHDLPGDATTRLRALAQRKGVTPGLLQRALERLGLMNELGAEASDSPSAPH
jgi:hypothetical protein